MNKYEFDAGFINNDNTVMRVNCRVNNGYFDILIDTWNDPYKCYYSTMECINDEDSFREALFKYLETKFPEYF